MPVKLKAFLFHLSGSAVVALLVLCLVYFVWYPGEWAVAAGVSGVFLLLLFVDVVLGPSLTALVYKPGKKSLKFDLSVIVLIQMAALAYGIHSLAEGRPAWIVYNVDRFDMVRVIDIDDRKLNEAKPEYRHASWFGPQWVSAQVPIDSKIRQQILFEAAGGGMDVPQKPELYVPLSDASELVKQRAHSLNDLRQFNPPEKVDEVLKQWPAATAWVPMMSNAHPMTVLLKKETAEVVAVVDLLPWKTN